MNTFFADFNAMTEKGYVRLTNPGSQSDIQARGVKPGDWVWLSDGELNVGAQVQEDDYWGVLGVPAWETMVYLEAEQPIGDCLVELGSLFEKEARTREDESRILQLLTWTETTPPSTVPARMPFDFEGRWAASLLALGLPELARLSVEQTAVGSPAAS